jgi:hypothetical protein
VDTVSILMWAVAIAGGLFAAYLVLHYVLFLLMAHPKDASDYGLGLNEFERRQFVEWAPRQEIPSSGPCGSWLPPLRSWPAPQLSVSPPQLSGAPPRPFDAPPHFSVVPRQFSDALPQASGSQPRQSECAHKFPVRLPRRQVPEQRPTRLTCDGRCGATLRLPSGWAEGSPVSPAGAWRVIRYSSQLRARPDVGYLE